MEPRLIQIGTRNRFAILDLQEDDQTDPAKISTTEPDLPVNYAIKDISWSREKAILELKKFSPQNIRKDRAGVLYLQFERESVGKNVLRWMRQKYSLNFTAMKVPVKTDPRCYHCKRIGHWGSACNEGLLSSLPVEIISCISSFLTITELLHFISVGKLISTSIQHSRSIVVANPLYLDDPMHFKCDFLKSFRSLQQLVLHGIRPKENDTGEFNVIEYIAQCSTLRSLSIRHSKLLDQENFTKLLGLTALTRLVVKNEIMPVKLIPNIAVLTNLIDLGLHVRLVNEYNNELNFLTCLTELIRLDLSHTTYWSTGKFSTLNLAPEIMTRLVSLTALDFSYIITPEMTRLEELDIGGLKEWTPIIAPNLTRLVCRCSIGESVNDYVNLKFLKMDFQSRDKHVISLPNLRALEFPKMIVDADITGCVNLERLLLKYPFYGCRLKVPPAISNLTLALGFDLPEVLKTVGELPLTRLDILKSALCDDVLKVFAGITTLQMLSFKHAATSHKPFMESLARFTQLKVLDLVHKKYLWRHGYNETSIPVILELSSKLPDTKILHGFQPCYKPKKPSNKYEHDGFCMCDRCSSRRAYEKTLDDESSVSDEINVLPAKFNHFLYH